MSWYRTYRPTTVAGLHLQSVRSALQKMMQAGEFPHALLFAGPKGTGKTSAARIIGAMLNDPQNATALTAQSTKKTPQALHEPDPHSDIVQRIYAGQSFVVNEMDAASNRGIDDIRQLRERVQLPPQEGVFTIYILDEVHMLTTEAFNALLKLLEEPPAHVVFILATTELHKIPATVLSRCTLVQFRKATPEELIVALEHILQAEKILFEAEALAEVVNAADGSFRDGVKLLEMVAIGEKKLTHAKVQESLHRSSGQQVRQLLDALMAKDEVQVVAFFEDLRQKNSDQAAFHTLLLDFLHKDLLIGLGAQEGAALFTPKISHYFLTQLSAVKLDSTGLIAFLPLELKVLELIFKSKEKTALSSGSSGSDGSSKPINPPAKATLPKTAKLQATSDVVPVLISETLVFPETSAVETRVENEEKIDKSSFSTNPISIPALQGQQLIEKWDEFLQLVKEKNSSVAALLRSSKPIAAEGEKARIEVYYQFHREQLQSPKFLQLLEECVQTILGGRVFFEFTLADHARAGAALSTISGKVNEEDHLIQLAKEILV
jgi:DNA polymerase-3 subunit gamma/tau